MGRINHSDECSRTVEGAPVCTCGAEKAAVTEAKARLVGTVKVVAWLGDRTCDICETEIKEQGHSLYDARMFDGRWAKLCLRCWQQSASQRLGVGHGQRYLLTGDVLVKVEG